jgi:hypothetical protein
VRIYRRCVWRARDGARGCPDEARDTDRAHPGVSVFEGIVYHCVCMDTSASCRPTLEVDALLRPGDTDAGPLLLSVAEYSVMVGDRERARRCLRELADKGRLVDHLGVDHIAFPTWTPVAPTGA